MLSELYLRSRSEAEPLRVGVLLESLSLPRALRQVLSDIASSNFARLELAVVHQQPPVSGAQPSRSTPVKYLRLLSDPGRRSQILFNQYTKRDQRNMPQPDPLEEVDCTDLLGSIPRLDVTPLAKRFVHRFPPEAVDALRSHKLDVLLRFGFNILRGDVLTSARYGIWSFHHGDNNFYRGGPFLFWEVVEDNPLSGVILQVLTDKLDDGLVLCKSIFATDRGLSRSRNIHGPYWGATHFVIRKLHELHERGWEEVKRRSVAPEPYQGKTEIYRSPTNFQTARWLVPKMAGKLLRKPFGGQPLYRWRMGLRRSGSPRLLSGPSSDLSDFTWVKSPPGHFYADPFVFVYGGQPWLFFEDYLYADQRGRIACAPIQEDLSLGPVTHCLDLPYHLSYPHIFSHDGDIFMIPESGWNRTVELYRATGFPSKWQLEKILFRGDAVDTTPLWRGDQWYFFTTLCDPPGNAAFGAVFNASNLTSDWILHPASPISTDVRTARSAGPVYVDGDRLIRPVQDCSEHYGRRIHFREVTLISPTCYQDRPLHSIEPPPHLQGIHTYGYCDGIEVLDAH